MALTLLYGHNSNVAWRESGELKYFDKSMDLLYNNNNNHD